MTAIPRWTTLAAAGLVAGCQPDPPAVKPDLPYASVERIAHAYHGRLLDAELREIELDVPLVAAMQASLIQELLKAADPKARERTEFLMAEASREKLPAEDRVLVDNAIAGSLLEQSPEELRRRYGWRYGMLASHTWQLVDVTARPEIREWIMRHGLDRFGFPPVGDGLAYMAECAAQGVPTPPDFPGPGWSEGVILPARLDLAGGGMSPVWVHTYTTDEGVCYALPREGSPVAVGIVCQGRRTGRGCFYDNLRLGTGQRIDWRRTQMVIARLQNGATLAENCTNCHRGDNAFIIHPESPLELPTADTRPEVRYTPIGRSDWTNPGPLALPRTEGRSCAGCHEIPELNPSYCLVLMRAAQQTMPPREPPAGWPPSRGHPFYGHVNFLLNRCTGA